MAQRIIYLFAGIVLIGWGAYLAKASDAHSVVYVNLGGQVLTLRVADTPNLQKKGLSGSKPLTQNNGMIFVFPKLEKYYFWMKDMTFPIDIIWLDESYKIISVEENATPESYPKIFVSEEPAQFVVELKAGFYREHNLSIGSVMEVQKMLYNN